MIWNESPWARWGLSYSTRDGLPTIAEASLWELEGRHPKVFRRAGGETYLLLDRTWRVVVQPNRAYVALVPADEPAAEEAPAPAAVPGASLA